MPARFLNVKHRRKSYTKSLHHQPATLDAALAGCTVREA